MVYKMSYHIIKQRENTKNNLKSTKKEGIEMNNKMEFFTTNMVLLTLLGIILMPGIADTWFEGTKYIFRATCMMCFYVTFMASTWTFGVIAFSGRKG